jgi:CubicO group peptidase (beta-lactamase class C family)
VNTSRTVAAAGAALLFALALIAPGDARAGASARNGKSIAAEARAIVDSYHELGWFSGSVLLAKRGEPIYQASVGLADRESATPNSLDTKFNLGSIMKDFTAVLVLQQVENGIIGLDDKLITFDLGFPPDIARKVTIRHLLNHRSGFPDAFPSAYRQNPLSFRTIAEKLVLLREAPLLFEPGTERRYSNYGYVVLGAILQRATGESFYSLLRENIFDPLKLEDTVYPYRKSAPNQSLRYTFNYAKEQAFVGMTEHHGPDGGIESTVADVLTFYRALFYGNALLSRESGAISEYFSTDGGHWTSYGGGTGVSSAVEIDLGNDYQVVVLANTDGRVAEEISGRIYSYIQTGSYKPIALPPVVFAWESYIDMGPEAFSSDFRARYESAGHDQFIGRTLNELGMSLLHAAKWNDAFNVFGTLVHLFPKAPQAYDSLAYAHFRAGDVGSAHKAFSVALELQPAFASDYSPDNYGHPAIP